MTTITLKTPQDVNNFPTADGTYNLTTSTSGNTAKAQIKIAGQVITFIQTPIEKNLGKSIDRATFLGATREALATGQYTMEVEQIAADRLPEVKDQATQSNSWWWIAALVGAAVLYHSRKKSA
jgi:hypothetical protein